MNLFSIRHLAAATVLLASTGPILAGNFSISTAVTSQQTLSGGQTGTVTSTGTLIVPGNNGTNSVAVLLTGASNSLITITNSGVIRQTGTARAIRAAGTGLNISITNNSGATIEAVGDDAMKIEDNIITLNNSGTIKSEGGQAVDWADIATKSNGITNTSTGLIQATGDDAVRLGVNGTLSNAGTVQALPTATAGVVSGSDGVDVSNNNGVQITNSGLIEGRHGVTGGDDTHSISISVTNNVGGTLRGVNGSGINIDNGGSSATILNNGTIEGNYDSTKYTAGDGDGVDVDGTVNLTNNGIIRALGADGVSSNPEGVSIGGGTVINNAGAQIIGHNLSGTSALGNGILVDDSNGGNAFAATTITNAGTIRGYTGFGIKITSTFTNSITNNAGGTIQGGGTDAAVQMGSGVDTLTNSGSIISDTGVAVDLGDGDDILNITGGSASISGSVSGGAGTNSATIDPGAGNNFTYSDSLSNFTTVEIKSGTVKLAGSNTYTGTTSVTGGKLTVASNAALGTTAGGTSVSPGAALALDGTSGNLAVGAESLTLNGAGVTGAEAGALQNMAGTNTYAGLVTLGSTTTIQSDAGSLALTNTGTITGSGFGLILTGSGNGSIASVIGTGAGGLTKNGSGTWTLTGVNTYTGGTTVNLGTLALSGSGNMGSTNGFVTINAGTLDLGGHNFQASTVTINGGSIINGTLTATSSVGFSGSGSNSLSSDLDGSTGVDVSGGGTATLSGTNTYSGATSVTNGTLVAGSTGALSSNSSFTVSGGATIDLNDHNSNVAGINGGGTIQSSGGTANLTVGSGDFSGTLTSGVGQLTKTGSGDLHLSGSNSYTGGTMITGGTLLITSTGALGSGAVNISGGGTLTNEGTGNLTFGHNVTNNGAINSGGHNVVFGGSTTLNGNGALTGGGTFTVMGTLSPGNSPGTVPVGANTTLTIDTGATTIWQLNAEVDNSDGTAGAGGNWDTFVLDPTAIVNVDGTLEIALDGPSFSNDPYWESNHSYTLFSGGGTVNGDFTSITGDFTYTNADGTGTFSRSGNEINYTFGPVPEPQTWALVALGVAAVIFRLRRSVKRD